MLHELLLALNGHTGSIFALDNTGKIRVAADLPFIHPTEVSLLNRICLLATHFNSFKTFIHKYGNLPRKDPGGGLHGLYLRALCEGLSLALDPYRKTLLDLEEALMADPHLSAAHVQSSLEEYQQLFPALASLIDQIENRKIHGCHILEVLHRASETGIPIVRNAVLQMLAMCHRVLYKQLVVWMLHGLLADQYAEFFVHKVAGVAPDVPSEGEQEDLGLGGITSGQIKRMIKLSNEGDRGTYEQFALRVEMLPSYIPVRVAEKILFVGESVQMFQIERQGTRLKHRESILRNREDIFAKGLEELSRLDVFSLRAFEEIIDKIRSYVAEQLWSLVVCEADLVPHLHTVKDIFLLGRGELFLDFIEQAQGLLRTPPSGTTQHFVNLALQLAARNVLLDEDHLLNKITLVVETTAAQRADTKSGHITASDEVTPSSENGWSALKLNYNVEWPLHILFTRSVIDRYNTLFKFLLFVKRVQVELQRCWSSQMQQWHLKTSRGDTKWWLRNHMSFLVDNFQYYLQVDVIESQFSILLEKIETTHDFEAIRFAHDQFLTSLLSQAFLLMKPIAHCINELLELCHSFCILLNQSDEQLTDRETAQLDAITKSFQRQSALLFKILSSVRNHQSGPHLAQLLLRIDFNKYFTNAGGQLGSIQMIPSGGEQPNRTSRRS